MNTKFQEVFQKNWYEELNYLPVIDLDKNMMKREVAFVSTLPTPYFKPDLVYLNLAHEKKPKTHPG
jgi:hypothetical protein